MRQLLFKCNCGQAAIAMRLLRAVSGAIAMVTMMRGLVTAYSFKWEPATISLPIALMTEPIGGDALASHGSTVFLSLLPLLSQPSKTLVPVVADARFPRRKKP